MDVSIRDKGVFAFGRFRLDAVRRSLTRDGEKLNLPPRLFDTLLYLVENQGRVVEKDELFNAVWGARIVEEANLTQTIFSLRKALGSEADGTRFIATVPGRGYRFATPVRLESGATGIGSASHTKLVELAPISLPIEDLPSAAAQLPSGRTGRVALPTVALCALAAVCVAGVAWLAMPARHPLESAASAAFEPPPQSVAVLPFANVSGDPGQEYFSDGLSDELINTLSQIDALHVVGRTSAFSFKGKQLTVAAIARELNVATMLEGSVRRESGRLRITVELIDSKSGFAIWSHSFDRDQNDVLHVQEAIATGVADALQIKLQASDPSKLSPGGTQNPFALDAYLRGLKLDLEGDLQSAKAALAAYSEAIRLDPTYALAHVKRSNDLLGLLFFEKNADPNFVKETKRLASSEADTAVALAPRLGLAHLAKANIFESQLNWRDAAMEDERALEMSPGDPNTLRVASADLFFLNPGNESKYIESEKKAIELDPLSPFGYEDLAVVYFFSRNYDEASSALKHGEELEPSVTTLDTVEAGMQEIMKGRPDAARAGCARQRDFLENACLALAFHALGMQTEADVQLRKLQLETDSNYPYMYARIFAQWGRTADALHWLGVAYQSSDSELNGIRQDPLLDPIRNSDEYKQLVKKLNFPS